MIQRHAKSRDGAKGSDVRLNSESVQPKRQATPLTAAHMSARAAGVVVSISLILSTLFSFPSHAADHESPGNAYEARALIQADAEVTLSSEISGRILDLPYREGDRFAQGDTLIRFDCSLHEGRLQVALASLKSAQLKLTNQQRRAELDAAGNLEVGLAEAELNRAKGDVAIARFPVDRCQIRAPFSGRIVQLGAHRHETISVGAPMVRILDDSRLEVKIVVPSQWLAWLKPGAPFEMRIDETGKMIQGVVSRMGAVIDAVSQSISVFANLDTNNKTQNKGDDTLISGMSGVVIFTSPSPTTASSPNPVR